MAAIATLLGYGSVTRTLAYSLRSSDAPQAHALAPEDGRITASLAQKIAGPDATNGNRATAGRLAEMALRQDPTAVAAVSTLGLNTQLANDTARARRLFAYAEKLSRRDMTTQLWAIENAVARGDVGGALRHYDIAMRTSVTAPDLLFPVLSSAISDEAVRIALINTLAARPNWGEAFANYVAARGPDPRATAILLTGLRRTGFRVPDSADAEVVNVLIFSKLMDDAWVYYESLRPGVDRRRSRDPRFATALAIARPAPFDWTLINDAQVNTSIQRGDKEGVLDFAAPAGIGGALARQLQVLPPGDYRLEGRSRGVEQPDSSAPYWTLTCNDGQELGRVVVPASARGSGRFAGRFTVPTGCGSQTLTLVARPSDMVSGLSGQISEVQLSPLR